MSRLRAPIVFLLVLVLVFGTAAPAVAAPGGALGFIKRAVDGVVDFAERILEPPHRAVSALTRWMGPVLGPLAADFAMGQLISSRSSVRRVVERLARAEQVSESVGNVQKDVNRLRQAYRDEAQVHRSSIEQLQWQADAIKSDPVAGDVRELISIRSLQDGHRRMAERLEARANTLSNEDVLALVGRRVIRQTVDSGRAVVVQEARSEIERLLGIEVIEDFTAGGISAEQAVELVLGSDVDIALIRAGIDPAEAGDVRDRIRDRLRSQLREQRANLRRNWQGIVRQTVTDAVQTVRHGVDAAPEGSAFSISAPYGITIRVFRDNSVRGTIEDAETTGEITVTMSATFTGTINEQGLVVASGPYTGAIVTPEETVSDAGTVTVRARRISDDTYEVTVTPSGGQALARSGMGTVKR